MYHPVVLQKMNEETEAYEDVKKIHALQVNHRNGAESFDSAAGQYHLGLVFRFAWTRTIEAIRFDPQHYRLMYNGQAFAVTNYDDYMERHLYVNVTGVAYG